MVMMSAVTWACLPERRDFHFPRSNSWRNDSVNYARLLIAVIVAFVTVWVTDFLIHAVWLSSTYGATKELWRPEAEMLTKMPFMFLGQFLVATGFVVIFAAFVAEKRCLRATLTYSAALGVLTAGGQIIMYAVQPFPGMLVVQWCLAYFAQMLVLGIIVHKVYQPAVHAVRGS